MGKGRVMQNKLWKIVCKALMVVFLTILTNETQAFASPQLSNRFNVVLVMDASGSMNHTDPARLRDEAIKLFSGLLADKGNKLGGVVFTEEIVADEKLVDVNGLSEKMAITDAISAIGAKGDTNIGLALDTAIDMIEKFGNPDNGSVILLLSDGKTDLKDKNDLESSLETKAEAVQRAREKGIKVYAVCLNADGKADTSEMQQISKATGGEFKEVRRAEDLNDAYRAFHGLIFGTLSDTIIDDVFPKSGRIDKKFNVPSFGVEEVNIVIFGNGREHSIEVLNPNGDSVEVEALEADTFSVVKLTDVEPGWWMLRTRGVYGDDIKVDLVYNTNLDVVAELDPSGDVLNPVDPVTVNARLIASDRTADRNEDFEGYKAEAEVIDDLDDSVVKSVPMSVEKGSFAASFTLSEGSYRLRVHVTGNYLDRVSNEIGPLTVTKDASTIEEQTNKAPEPIDDPVTIEVTLWPFRDNTTTIDLSDFVKDDQDDELNYAVVSSSFMDEDYTFDNSTIILSRYSMSIGDFKVRAQDSWGKKCEFTVTVRSKNIPRLIAIGMCIAAAVALIVLCIKVYHDAIVPFYGDTTVYAYIKGVKHGGSRIIAPPRGKRRLSSFSLDPTGLNYRKCYLQATGKRYVYLITDRPVSCKGVTSKKIRIESSRDERITISEGMQLFVRFDSTKTVDRPHPGNMWGKPTGVPKPKLRR